MSAREDDLKRVQDACQVLIEHFDTVQIFCTRHEPEVENGTINVNYGEGNWFARYGLVHEWMTRQDERTRQHIRSND